MKKLIAASSIATLLILTGCGSTEPTPADEAAAQQVGPVQTETVPGENASVLNENGTKISDSNEMNMASIENKMISVTFDYDKFNIKPEMKERITKHAEIANTIASKFTIKLEGNCDEWGSDEYNFALGLKRADAVKKALVAEGVDASRIKMVSFGESNPVCTDKTQECWAKNRRVDFKVLP